MITYLPSLGKVIRIFYRHILEGLDSFVSCDRIEAFSYSLCINKVRNKLNNLGLKLRIFQKIEVRGSSFLLPKIGQAAVESSENTLKMLRVS